MDLGITRIGVFFALLRIVGTRIRMDIKGLLLFKHIYTELTIYLAHSFFIFIGFELGLYFLKNVT